MSSSQRVDSSGLPNWLPASVLGGVRPDPRVADAPPGNPSFQRFTRLGYAAMSTIISAALWTAWMGDVPEPARPAPAPPLVVAPPVAPAPPAPETREPETVQEEPPRARPSAPRPARRKHARARAVGQRGIRPNPY